MNRLLSVCVFGFFICIVPACHNAQQNTKSDNTDSVTATKQKNISVPGSFSSQTILHFDSSNIAQFIKKYPLFSTFQKDIEKFYSARQYAYAWCDTSGVIEQADNLYNQVMNIDKEGISKTILYKDSLAAIFAQPSANINPEKELILTAQYFSYAQEVWGGISEEKTKKLNWFLPRKKLDLPFLMDSLLRDTSSSLIKNGYSYRQYALLKEYLKRYRDIASKNNWKQIKTDKKSYGPGDSSQVIGTVREKLFVLGDLSSNSGSDVFDDELQNSIKSFQGRFGIKQNGAIGQATINQLNIPVEKYIEQIIVNMERCRWVPANLTGDYMIVNIPDFRLYAFEQDSVALTMKVVVGKSVHKTVIFNGDLKYVVFSPYWNVPPDIMKNEVLPAIRKDPNYLIRNNMEWNGKSIRQKPGPKNSLGLVKFLFPNEYNIYLHDSPAKSLFNEDQRAFSHGCIRVEQPKKLAEYLLRKDTTWTEARIHRSMKSGKEQYVTLKNTVPVFIAYLTAWVDRQGKLNLRNDIYKRDDNLAAMLMKN